MQNVAGIRVEQLGFVLMSKLPQTEREAPGPFPPVVRLANTVWATPNEARLSGWPCTWKTLHPAVLTHSGTILTGIPSMAEDSSHACEKQSLDAQHLALTSVHVGPGKNSNGIITSSAHGPREDRTVWNLKAPHSYRRMTAMYKWSRSTYFHSPWPSERVSWLSWCPFTKEGNQRPWWKDPPPVLAPSTTWTLKMAIRQPHFVDMSSWGTACWLRLSEVLLPSVPPPECTDQGLGQFFLFIALS